ncbi:hypothetical protein [Hymenobacter cellulosivorans]|uniref:Transcriptional regulator n=1 Tax=Hymenobacter cellulosivorans TaxID=2932249 RepID=A0ABY4F4Y3_9BACT|nr:hypothetical protein [Hymenobacter cellulosivorans]UOQ51727.1 hypothetical protein MUN80_18420 [Hymenobacter cellulosivorans]
MNYVHHTRAAHEQLLAQPTSRPHHISLYLALFRQWNTERFPESMQIDRREVMQAARIGNRDTYLAALRDLEAWSLLTYRPSHNTAQGSRIQMVEVGPEVSIPRPGAMPKSEPTPPAHVSPEAGQQVAPEVSRLGPEVGPEVGRHSLYNKTVDTKQVHKQGGIPQKKGGQVFAGEGLSAAEILPDELPTNGAAGAPKEKVAPKRKGVGQATIRKAAARAATTGRGGKARPQRPEVPFAESELARYEDFAAAFEGTDYQLADLRFYHAQVTNWRKDGEPPRRRDWKATATKFMLNDAHDNRLKLAPGAQQHRPGHSPADPGTRPAETGYRSKYDA